MLHAMQKIISITLISILATLLIGCGLNGKKIDPYEGLAAKEIYDTGVSALQRGDYDTAIKAFQGLDAHYPFGDYTIQGQLNIIYAYYGYTEYPLAVDAADRFIRLHPKNPNLDYAYYMRGLIKFEENTGLLEKIFPMEPSKRDTSGEVASFDYFGQLVRLYPDSIYAKDARQRMIYLRNNMAKHHLEAADYYYRRGAYLASANRARTVVEDFDGVSVMPDALKQMARAYDALGLTDLAKDARRVLAENYPTKEQ